MKRPAPLARTDFYLPGFDRPFCAHASKNGLFSIALPGAEPFQGDDLAGERPFPEAEEHLDKATSFLRAYFLGHATSPRHITLDRSGWTPFQTNIYETLMQVPFAEVVSYGGLALLAGHPQKARAAGSAMRRNRCPIVIPCHRVVAAGHRLGGWSGPAGFKEKLLQHEGLLLPNQNEGRGTSPCQTRRK